MKTFLKSIALIGFLGAVVFGATSAFFSDTETSTGNVLSAGKIDLKVDHAFASYDGNPCTKNCVEDTGNNLILNGSFEVPEVTDGAQWQIFPSGTSGLVWTVEWNGGSANFNSRPRPEPALVEYHEGVLGLAQEGDQYAELDADWYGPNDPLNGEPALVQIFQNVATTPGMKYKLHYYFSPRPNTGTGENSMDVEINDLVVQSIPPTAGGGAIAWTEYSYEFTATGATTKIEFVGKGTNNSLGVFLDNVSVHPINCTYVQTGGTCTLWEEKDLGDGDVFWNFDDVKPGDYGVNILSLHVDDNDAFACLNTQITSELDNTLVEPEVELADTLTTGELSQFLKVFVWEDSTQNNVYDIGEHIFVGPDVLLTTAIGTINIAALNTKYIGIAWCAGTQTLVGNAVNCDGSTMGNIAQTDSVVASLTAYAEQQRNNPNFSCNGAEKISVLH